MGIDLTQFERGEPLPGDGQALIAAAQSRLAALQIAQIVHRKRAIILFEGWDGAGKRSVLRQLAAALDPCHLSVHCAPLDGSDDRHWLARYWAAVPHAGHTIVHYRSWYRQAVEARLAGRLNDRALARATDEINEFESQQRDHDTMLVKLFFHVSAERQAERLRARADDPWQRWLGGADEGAALARRPDSLRAWHALFAATDTRWAPWRIIDSADSSAATLAALQAIGEALQSSVPSEPPVDENVVALSRPHSA